MKLGEAITIDVRVGDTILMGKYKNKRVVVKDIGTDEHGMPTINGKKAATFRTVPKVITDEPTINNEGKMKIADLKIMVREELAKLNEIDTKKIRQKVTADQSFVKEGSRSIRAMREALDEVAADLNYMVSSLTSELHVDMSSLIVRRYVSSMGETVDIHRKNDNDNTYTIAVSDNRQVYINFQNKKIIKTQSLADPRAAYQTTSAYRFKTEKAKIARTFPNVHKAKDAMTAYLSKLQSKGYRI